MNRAARRPVLVMPAFNEESRLAAVLDRIAACERDYEVVVVDDGSKDRTAEVAERCGARVLRHPFNLGYGAAIQTGYKYALRCGAELLVQMDADGQHDPAQLDLLIEPVEAGESDLVIGSRFLGSDYRMGFARSAGRLLLQAVGRSMELRITDPTSGFQAMNRKVLALYVTDLFPTDFPDLDVLLIAHRQGLRITERSVQMAPSPRASYLHSGLAPIYYLYRMGLSIWAGGPDRRRKPDPPMENRT